MLISERRQGSHKPGRRGGQTGEQPQQQQRYLPEPN